VNRSAFRWIVRHLRWLARIPGVPHFFDTILFLGTAVFHPRRRAAMEVLEAEILRRLPCHLATHRLGGSAYRIEGREIAHLHGNGLLDVHLDRARAAAFIAAQRAEPHHALGPSAWVSYWLESPDDVPGALALIEAAVGSH
jgi:hypothetical protein